MSSTPNDSKNTWTQKIADYVSDPLAAPAPVRAQLGTETILIADDDKEVCRGLASVLRRYGFKVLEAATGAEAVRLAESEQGPIHLLLADVVMPTLTTDQLRTSMARIRPNTVVAFMSGYIHDNSVRDRVLGAPVPFLAKPFTSMDLVRSIRTMLDERQN